MANTNPAAILANYPGPRQFYQNVHMPRDTPNGAPYFYMKNHKAACTTIIATLLNLHHQTTGSRPAPQEFEAIHGSKNEVFLGERDLPIEQLIDRVTAPGTFAFTLIRNPISRTVSAFADKMSVQGAPRRHFNTAAGRRRQQEIDLSGFLDILAQVPEALDADRHWRPQSREIAYGQIEYDLIADLPDLGQVMDQVAQQVFGLDKAPVQDTRESMGHATPSRELVSGLSPQDLRNIERALESDFAMYEAVTGKSAAA